jgi:hypothetical protein
MRTSSTARSAAPSLIGNGRVSLIRKVRGDSGKMGQVTVNAMSLAHVQASLPDGEEGRDGSLGQGSGQHCWPKWPVFRAEELNLRL